MLVLDTDNIILSKVLIRKIIYRYKTLRVPYI